MKRKVIAAAVIAVVLISLVAASARLASRDLMAAGAGKDRVAVLHISGVIMGGKGVGGLFGATTGADDMMGLLREVGRDPSIKAVVLRINSPGGTTGASQELGMEIERLRESGVVVVASMSDVAASGGYWISACSDYIMASPGTTTGSIGVIIETQDLQGLYDKLGIDSDVFKSGPHKDMGSPNRDLTQTERAILQGMVDDLYQQFVDVVAKGRDLDRAQVLEIADGRVFTGRQAMEAGLVDEMGNYYDAVAKAAELAGIEGEPEIYELEPLGGWQSLLGEIRLGRLAGPWQQQPVPVPAGLWLLDPNLPAGYYAR
ncbi:MAG: signal peptide peptidase SppA [Bacillota bacterium]|jgi:protease-4